jgi:RNA polymerase sigma-70 factor (ECF subfamily)
MCSATIMTRRARQSKINNRKSQIADRRFLADPEVVLMLRVGKGDGAAFEELVRRYWSRVFGHFYRRLGDRQEAEDLTQDVFLRLYRYRRRYRPRAKFITWLFFIAQNVARNAVRSRRRHPCTCLEALSRPTRDGEPLEGLFPDNAEAPSRPMERAEAAVAVRAAVAELAERQRAAMELHQFHNRTYSEVAAELDMSPKAAKSLLYRARLQLRESLTPFMEVNG